jgi:actin-related protein
VETILLDNLGLDNCNISLLIAEDIAVDLEPSEVLKQRQKIADYLLEGMELSNIAFIKKPILTAFSLGRTSATVLDSGHSFSHCSIVEDGYCTYNKSIKIGGSLVLSMLQSQIIAQTKNKVWKINQ